ncbi:hypothetical protein [Jannaschia aquimarina]|uniref:hypothetical protein n=1 Tax=Jannaschia aquimarina TaxID=935700 RepID=UPI001379185C|nr:hypothetical protein [Jannaschia aquimarina]
MAGRLQQQGFRGNYIAFATDIPHEEMIREEIASVAPGIALTIVPMGHGPRLADC